MNRSSQPWACCCTWSIKGPGSCDRHNVSDCIHSGHRPDNGPAPGPDVPGVQGLSDHGSLHRMASHTSSSVLYIDGQAVRGGLWGVASTSTCLHNRQAPGRVTGCWQRHMPYLRAGLHITERQGLLQMIHHTACVREDTSLAGASVLSSTMHVCACVTLGHSVFCPFQA